MRVKVTLKDGTVIVTDVEMLDAIETENDDIFSSLQSIEIVGLVHSKLLKYRNADLTEIQDLSTVEQDIADVERDLEIIKQRLPLRLYERFDDISIDKKELDSLKQRVQAEKQRRAQPQQPQQPEE